MTETTQRERLSLVDRVRQMAGVTDSAAAPRSEEPPVVLPDGYRRRSPVQHYVRRARRISRRTLAIIGLLVAVVLLISLCIIIF